MRKDRSRPGRIRHRAHVDIAIGIRLVRHVVNGDTRQVDCRAAGLAIASLSLLLRLEDERRAATPILPRTLLEVATSTGPAAAAIGSRGNGGLDIGIDAVGVVVVPQLGKGLSEILSVHHGVGGILHALLPVVGRARGRADEEELAGIGQGQMLVGGGYVDGGWLAKVDAAALAEDGLTVPDGADGNSGLLVEKGDDDAAKRLEWRPGEDGCRLADEVADGLEVFGGEDVERVDVCKDERVGRRRGLAERRKVGEIEAERRAFPRGAAGGGSREGSRAEIGGLLE